MKKLISFLFLCSFLSLNANELGIRFDIGSWLCLSRGIPSLFFGSLRSLGKSIWNHYGVATKADMEALTADFRDLKQELHSLGEETDQYNRLEDTSRNKILINMQDTNKKLQQVISWVTQACSSHAKNLDEILEHDTSSTAEINRLESISHDLQIEDQTFHTSMQTKFRGFDDMTTNIRNQVQALDNHRKETFRSINETIKNLQQRNNRETKNPVSRPVLGRPLSPVRKPLPLLSGCTKEI